MTIQPPPVFYPTHDKPLRWADFWLPVGLVATMWAVHIVQRVGGFNLWNWGISPKSAQGLVGVLTGPLIHADWGHLVSNSAPMLVAGGLMSYFYPSVSQRALAMIYILTGVFVWIFARHYSTHIGASGVVYGLVAFIAWLGILRRSRKAVILALLVLVLYGGMLTGIAPNPDRPNVSWESHLIGGLVGIFAAYFYKDLMEEDELPLPKAPEAPKRAFLPADTFEKTRLQRELENQALLDQIRQYWQQQNSTGT